MKEKFNCKKCKKKLSNKDGYDKGYCFKCISDVSPTIIIYTTPEVLEHKKKDGRKGDCCYWRLKHRPQRLNKYGRHKIFFATKGFIRGYFIIHDMEGGVKGVSRPNWFAREKDKSISDDESFSARLSNVDLCFHSESWVGLSKLIPTKSFQGFKYADKVKELSEVKPNSSHQ